MFYVSLQPEATCRLGFSLTPREIHQRIVWHRLCWFRNAGRYARLGGPKSRTAFESVTIQFTAEPVTRDPRRKLASMRPIHINISPESPFFRAFVISAVMLIALIWRLNRTHDRFFSTKVGLACIFCAFACFGVWGIQRATGQRWSWPVVFLAVCGSTVAIVWLTVAITRAARFA